MREAKSTDKALRTTQNAFGSIYFFFLFIVTGLRVRQGNTDFPPFEGRRYGFWTVLRNGQGRGLRVRCICGFEAWRPLEDLAAGLTTGCAPCTVAAYLQRRQLRPVPEEVSYAD